MKASLKYLSGLLLLGGLGIIIAAFFLFLKDLQDEKLFYLNLAVTCLVYFVILYRSSDLFGSVETVARSSSGYGLKWLEVWIYAPLAIALVVVSFIYGLGFNLCLLVQLALLLVLISFFFVGALVKHNVNEVVGKIEAKKTGLKEIAAQIDLLEMQNKLAGRGACQEDIDRLRENLRFITASDSPSAIALENKLIEKIRLIISRVERKSETPEVFHSDIEECLAIVELRKKQY